MPSASDVVHQLSWNGYLVVGAGRELPAHLMPSEQIVRPLWKSGFVVEIQEVPEILEVRLDWVSTGPSPLMMMTHAPHGAERPEEQGWSEYATHTGPNYATTSPLCMRIPAADLAEDHAHVKQHGGAPHWYPMAHSLVGLDVELRFTVSHIGGRVEIPGAYHGHPTNAEELVNIYETIQGPYREFEPCQLEPVSV